MSEKLQWSEAEAVVRAYRAEHGLGTDVDVATLAQALGTDVAEVRRLSGRKPRFTDRSGVLSAALALGVAAAALLLAGPALLAKNPLLATLRPTPPTFETPVLAPMPPMPPVAARIQILTPPNGRIDVREMRSSDDM